MKNTLFLTALLGMLPHLHAAVGDVVTSNAPFIADGVKVTYFNGPIYTSVSVTGSTRFYDSTKGWVIQNDTTGDNQMCWAHSASNILQYWQSYYGVFCKDSRSPVYGAYDSEYETNPSSPAVSTQIANPLKLNMMKHIVDSKWSNSSGSAKNAFDWYFTWNPSQSAGAGYYREYFGQYSSNVQPQTCTLTDLQYSQTIDSLTNALLPALGINEVNGTLTQTESGLIANFIVTSGGSSAHALTCYGVTLDDNGKINSIIYADSDNAVFTDAGQPEQVRAGLQQVYVSDENGALRMYEDKDCTQQWNFYNSSADYRITSVTGINTPEVLKNMLAEYSDTDKEALIWNGSKNATWKTVTSTTEQLPTEATGWDVLVNGDNIEAHHQGYYHSYAEDGRAVVFDTHGMNGSTETQVVTVTGTVTPGTITVKEGGNYHLQAGTGAAIAGSGDVSIESGGKLSSEINFESRTITAQSGGHFAYAATDDMTLNGKISGDSGSIIQFRNGSTIQSVIYTAKEDLNWRDNTITAIKGTLIVGDTYDSHATHLDLSPVKYTDLHIENLSIYGTSSLKVGSGYYVKVSDTFSSLKTLQDANSLNLRAATNTTATPTIHNSLDLSGAQELVMETAVSLDNNQLSLKTPLALTLDLESFGISVTPGERFNVALFTHVDSLTLDTPPNDNGDGWAAAKYFTSEYIDASTRLVWADGTVSLVGLTVPEPATATLSLLALASLAARRRRR